ncbi:hypothetical protein ACFX2J_006961 [Malus domestica]
MGMTAQGSNIASSSSNSVHEFSVANTWVVDTGATRHMTADLDILSRVTPYTGDVKITVGSGEGLPVHNIGLSIINTSSDSLILHNVLHVPKITMNLLSIKKLCKDNGCWFICDYLTFFIQDKATHLALYQGKSNDGELFEIPVTVFQKSFATRLGRCAAFWEGKLKLLYGISDWDIHQKRY